MKCRKLKKEGETEIKLNSTKQIIYPGIFRPCQDGFSVDFPDLPGCVSEGVEHADALCMAQEAIREKVGV